MAFKTPQDMIVVVVRDGLKSVNCALKIIRSPRKSAGNKRCEGQSEPTGGVAGDL
jgi:hypothetical protein